MNVSPAPTVSTTSVGKPGTRVTAPPGSTATPPPGPSVMTASPRPYCSTQPAAISSGSAPPAARARNLMSSSLALTIPCRRPDRPQPRLHLGPVLDGLGDHRGTDVDVVRHPAADRRHPVQEHLGARADDARQRGDVQPVVLAEPRQVVDLPAEVRRVAEVERVARDPRRVQADHGDRRRLGRLRREVQPDARGEDVLAQLAAERVARQPPEELRLRAPSLPRATAEFIGPPADSASHVDRNEVGPSVDDWTRSMRVSPHTTKRVMPAI